MFDCQVQAWDPGALDTALAGRASLQGGVAGPAADVPLLSVRPSATFPSPRLWLPWNPINQPGRPWASWKYWGAGLGEWERSPQGQERVNIQRRCLDKLLPEQQEAQAQLRLGPKKGRLSYEGRTGGMELGPVGCRKGMQTGLTGAACG